MAYRGDDASHVVEAPTAEGTLRAVIGPGTLELTVARRALHVAGARAMLVEHGKPARGGGRRAPRDRQRALPAGRLMLARGWPREDLAVWLVGRDARGPVARRVFGVAPVPVLEPGGLASLRRLDAVAHRVRDALAAAASDTQADVHAAPASRAVELGSADPLDRVLLDDDGERVVVYARRLFREGARRVLAAGGGRVVLYRGQTAQELRVASRFAITVRADDLRFTRAGVDAHVAIPWLMPEDRDELARRLGMVIERSAE